MRVILNELGRRTVMEWLRPKCPVCLLPMPHGEKPDPTKHEAYQYRRCCGCDRYVVLEERSRAYKMRWDQHYLHAVQAKLTEDRVLS